jgi:hypothetical protein
MQTGTHLPHPDLSSKQIATQSIVRQNGEKLMIDGRKIDNWASISIRVEPDYWRVLV